MNFEEALDYLFIHTLKFSKLGKNEYKPGLHNISVLCEKLGNPQNHFKSVHIAGTNGKGSTSHFLASIFMEAGFKTGLYTSPHLKKFNERISINGVQIADNEIVDFVNNQIANIEELKPSFFEITTAMAFDHFSRNRVDIAIIETGLGGRLDATNILTPILSIITQIGYDHTDILGTTLPLIAEEKAGIIKKNVPLVISEYQHEIFSIFQKKCIESNSTIHIPTHIQVDFVSLDQQYMNLKIHNNNTDIITNVKSGLLGHYQTKNIKGVLCATEILQQYFSQITSEAIHNGLQNVVSNTCLKGRWQILKKSPFTICDVAHNVSGVKEAINQLKEYHYEHLYIIFGASKDKNIQEMLQLIPKEAAMIFTQAHSPRAMPAEVLYESGKNIFNTCYMEHDVNQAIMMAYELCSSNDMILVLGSIFLIAEIEQL